MKPERYFFEIPIYRISENRFNEIYDRDLRRHWQWFARGSGYGREQVSQYLRMGVEQHFWEIYGGPWRFNQAVGWLRLFVLGSQIRGELWVSAAKRVHRKGLRRFRWFGEAFEIHCSPEQSSDDIGAEVEGELRRFRQRYRNGRFVLDLECFRSAAACIDWRRLAGLEAERTA